MTINNIFSIHIFTWWHFFYLEVTINNVFSIHIHLYYSYFYWDGLGQNHHGVRRGIEGFQRRLPTKNSKHQTIISIWHKEGHPQQYKTECLFQNISQLSTGLTSPLGSSNPERKSEKREIILMISIFSIGKTINHILLEYFDSYTSLDIPWERSSSPLEVSTAWPAPGGIVHFVSIFWWLQMRTKSQDFQESTNSKTARVLIRLESAGCVSKKLLYFTRLELKDTASYTGERLEEDPEEVTIRITLVHLAIIGL